MSKKERVDVMGDQPKKFKNVFVKNFGDVIDEGELREMFIKYGPINSVVIMTDMENKSRGFGFVAFQDHDSAEMVFSSLLCYIFSVFYDIIFTAIPNVFNF